jgi:hypothetical protein
MQKLLLVLLVFLAAPGVAQKAFDGTWRINLQSGEVKGNDRYALQDGVWHCYTCGPEITVQADGKPHKVSSQPYFDTATVREVDDHTVEITSEKNGKPSGTNKITTSNGGKVLTSEGTFTTDNGQQIKMSTIYDRVGNAPASGNKVSGTWHQRKIENASENITKVTYKANDDGLVMSDLLGDSYDAKFDGKDYPFKGDPGTSSVSLKKIDANTIEETDKRNGKVISVSRMTVAADGKTMKVAVDDKLHNQTANWTAEKE